MKLVRQLSVVLAVLLATGSFAQFDFGGGMTSPPKPAWEQFTLPKKTLKLDFKNANIDMVISLFEKTSGITIVKDPNLKNPITITSAKAVSLSEAFQILSTTLRLQNYELAKEGNLLVIRRMNQRGGNNGGMSQDQMREWMERLRGGGDEENRTELRVYPIQYANAASIARMVNEVFGGAAGNRGGGFPNFGGGGNNNRNQQMMQMLMGGQGGAAVRASSDDYSNTVIVNASSGQHRQIEELLKQIDKPTDDVQETRVFPLEFAPANELAGVIQNVLTSNAPKGRGGQGNTNVPFEQRFGAAMRLGGNFQAAFGTVIADTRTNSLVVTATKENLLLVEKVIDELDSEVKLEANTFVFPLDNARADDMADLLNQAFGSRNNGNRNNRNNNGRFTTTNRNNNNRNNNNRNFGGGGGINFGGNGGRAPTGPGAENDPNSLYLDLEDPDQESGMLQTNIGVSQGFFGQFGQPQGTGTTGRNAAGQIVNINDLTGQVTVIPDPNTNSLIVVTTPEGAELLRQILAQLDKIPEQVMIETIIVEATLDESSKMGVEWQAVSSNLLGNEGVTGTGQQTFGLQNANPALQGFRYTVTGGNLTGFINLLKSDDKFQVLSTPRIFTSNNVEAEINISQRVPFVVSQREDPNGNITFNYDFEDVGIVLTVTPRITANGYVTMDVSQTANDLQGFTDFNAPIVNQRQANTTVAVKDGETIILGGIMRSTVTSKVRKIPLLGDIPILGNLFKSTEKSNQKTELLVFLTPRVVRDPDEARKLREEEEKKLSKQSQEELKKATGGGENKSLQKKDPPTGGGGN